MTPATRPLASGSPSQQQEADTAGAPPQTGALAGRRWRSSELFGAHQQEIEIEHGQAVYRLRLTSLGKLILTK